MSKEPTLDPDLAEYVKELGILPSPDTAAHQVMMATETPKEGSSHESSQVMVETEHNPRRLFGTEVDNSITVGAGESEASVPVINEKGEKERLTCTDGLSMPHQEDNTANVTETLINIRTQQGTDLDNATPHSTSDVRNEDAEKNGGVMIDEPCPEGVDDEDKNDDEHDLNEDFWKEELKHQNQHLFPMNWAVTHKKTSRKKQHSTSVPGDEENHPAVTKEKMDLLRDLLRNDTIHLLNKQGAGVTDWNSVIAFIRGEDRLEKFVMLWHANYGRNDIDKRWAKNLTTYWGENSADKRMVKIVVEERNRHICNIRKIMKNCNMGITINKTLKKLRVKGKFHLEFLNCPEGVTWGGATEESPETPWDTALAIPDGTKKMMIK